MDYPVCLSHNHSPPPVPEHTVNLVILISPRTIRVYLWQVGKHYGLLSRSLVRCPPTEILVSLGQTKDDGWFTYVKFHHSVLQRDFCLWITLGWVVGCL